MEELTSRQEQILNYIVVYFRKTFHFPTWREIGNEHNIRSTNGVHDHLMRLKTKGWVEIGANKNRGIFLTEKTKRRYSLYFIEEGEVPNG